MSPRLEDLRGQIAALEVMVADELAKAPPRLHNLRAGFDAETRALHRAARETLAEFVAHTRPLHLLTAPVIYSLILPFVLLDLCVTLYQAICFPVYHVDKVRRADHIVIDRHHLGYLNFMQKLNCLYCSYCNGLISYVRTVAGRTEAYWCPIKHAYRTQGTHEYQGDFVEYGDAAAWRARLRAQRAAERPQ